MMKYFFTLLILSAALSSCNDESAAGPGESDTFIKLYGSENTEIPNAMLETSDGGIIILSTSTIESSTGESYKIKVRNTDKLGNLIWERSYPEGLFEETKISYKASSIISNDAGYIIIGDRINDNNKTSLLILQIDQTGTETGSNTFTLGYSNDTTSLHGVDLIINSNNEIKTTALIDTTAQNLWVGTFNAADLSYEATCSFRFSSAGTNTKLLQSISLDDGDDIVYGISTGVNLGKGRLVKVPTCQGAQTTGAGVDYIANQMTKSLTGYAMVGTTTGDENDDIFLARLNPNGVLDDPNIKVYPMLDSISSPELGLCITQTADGGFLLGGSILNSSGGETDIIIAKTDFLGNLKWSQRFGDENDDRALILKQASSGGYFVLGDTDFGGIGTIILIKTDRTGNVN